MYVRDDKGQPAACAADAGHTSPRQLLLLNFFRAYLPRLDGNVEFYIACLIIFHTYFLLLILFYILGTS